jgi:hypothetical protein
MVAQVKPLGEPSLSEFRAADIVLGIRPYPTDCFLLGSRQLEALRQRALNQELSAIPSGCGAGTPPSCQYILSPGLTDDSNPNRHRRR